MVFTEQKGGPPVKTILEWWKERGHAFALISEVAKLIIAVPATSAPSERVFSTAGRASVWKVSSFHVTPSRAGDCAGA